jgi:hypothetical protein
LSQQRPLPNLQIPTACLAIHRATFTNRTRWDISRIQTLIEITSERPDILGPRRVITEIAHSHHSAEHRRQTPSVRERRGRPVVTGACITGRRVKPAGLCCQLVPLGRARSVNERARSDVIGARRSETCMTRIHYDAPRTCNSVVTRGTAAAPTCAPTAQARVGRIRRLGIRIWRHEQCGAGGKHDGNCRETDHGGSFCRLQLSLLKLGRNGPCPGDSSFRWGVAPWLG